MLEKTLESLLDCKGIQAVHPKGNQSWRFTGRTDAEAETPNTLATWCEELTHLKRSWCWERLKVGEGDDRGWDGWLASLTQWTWVWVNSGSWWWTGRPGVLQSMGSQRVGHDWVTELNWTVAQLLVSWQTRTQSEYTFLGHSYCCLKMARVPWQQSYSFISLRREKWTWLLIHVSGSVVSLIHILISIFTYAGWQYTAWTYSFS